MSRLLISVRWMVCVSVMISAGSTAYGQSCAYSEGPVQSCGFPRTIDGTPGQHVVYVDTSTSTTSTTLCGRSVTNVAWFEVRPTVSGPLTISTCHPLTSYDTVLTVYSGGNTECQGMDEIDCDDDDPAEGCDNGCSYRASTVTIPNATAGSWYRFAVGEYAGSSGTCVNCLGVVVTIGAPCGDAPDNFICELAEVLPGTPGTHSAEIDVTDAPSNVTAISCPGSLNIGHGVWFTFTPTVTGQAVFSTCDPNTAYDTVARVVTGCGGVFAQIDCNDDYTGCTNACGTDRGSRVTFDVSAGLPYYIEVGSYNDSTLCDMCLGVDLTINECMIDADCDDGNPCSADECDAGICLHDLLPMYTPCPDDGDECTQDYCYHGGCTHPTAPDGTACGSPASTECDNPDSCLAGVCQRNYVPSGVACSSDGNDCTDDYCHRGTCLHPTFGDGTPCGSPADTDCDDPDACFGGVCQPNYVPSGTVCSDDGNACTYDRCNGTGACTHPSAPNGTSCGSGSNTDCDNPDNCFNGVCQANYEPSGTACTPDGNDCTRDACDGFGQCVHPSAPNGTFCGSGSDTSCDNPDTCLNGVCLANHEPPGTPCPDDGNDCTDDHCDGGGACAHPTAPNGTSCGSGADTPCDNPDSCFNGNCQPNYEPPGVLCPDDGNICTDDLCNGAGSCVHQNVLIGTPCSNGLYCDGEETCDDQGSCQPGTPPCRPSEVCDETTRRCMSDCNRNGVPDDEDIAQGSSDDHNDNGIPDDCEVSHPIRNCTPVAWAADDVTWSRDLQPHNKIDDLIDASPDAFFDIVVNFKRCIEDDDIDTLRRLSPQAEIQKRLKYISSVAVANVARESIVEIAALPYVVFIEQQVGFGLALDVSVPNICVTTGTCSPNTVEQQFPNIDGSGVNIVIMDTGVDNGVHSAFASGQYVAGYDATTTPPTFTDPDDDDGHGTHVASIALGHATTNTSRGVAPGAGLIDVRVFTAATTCATTGMWLRVVDALEVTFDRRNTWNVDVINMSFGQCNASGSVASDGGDAFSQLVDLAESMGIVVVAAAGNAGPTNTFLTSPAAATRAITVAASNDSNTQTRADDTIANFSSRGPRDNDGDTDTIDELKPEVTAPGAHGSTQCGGFDPANGIRAARFNTASSRLRLCGTSMAAPHVAGVAALIMDARPGINAASVKDLIISTATSMGTPSNPTVDATWNDRWGWGLIDAFAALNVATANDLTFPSHPPAVGWLSPDITTVPFPLKKGQPATVTAQIRNNGATTATDVRIHFGVHTFSASTPTFHDIGTRIVDIPANPTSSTPVSIQWTPQQTDHQCLRVEIGYGPDTDYTNNRAQRNITKGQAPVHLKVQNSVTEAATQIDLVPTLEDSDSGWTFSIDQSSVILAADDCAASIEAELSPPAGAPPGSRQTLHVAAVAQTPLGVVEVGGVSIQRVTPCSVHADCDDEDPCTEDECDSQNSCANTPDPLCRRCGTHDECEDDNECTDDVCGASGACTYTFAADGTACGSSEISPCDRADTCQAGACSNNAISEATPCPDDGNECTDDICDGYGLCTHPAVQDGLSCGAGGGECLAETCIDGNCMRVALDAGSPCGASNDTLCDAPDTCDGNGACVPNHSPSGTQCSDGLFCNGDELCDGSGTCLSGTPPCPPGSACDENEGRCITDVPPGQCFDPATDTNGDNRVDHQDFHDFLVCFDGPEVRRPVDPPWCFCVDLNDDGHIDLRDYATWQHCHGGTDLPADRDCDGAVPETLRPDQRARLAVTSLSTAPAFPAVGEQVNVVAGVRNAADMTATAVAVIFSGDGTQLDLQRIDLPPRSTRTVSFIWTAGASGVHVLGAQIDPDEEFVDNDLIDNTMSIEVVVADPPPTAADFAIMSLDFVSLPDRPVVPQVTIANNGGVPGETVFTLLANEELVATQFIGPLSPSESVTIHLPWPPELAPGHIRGEVNPRYHQQESDPDDNILAKDFHPLVDLRVERLTVHALRLEPPRPQRATVSFRVVNGSTGPVTTPFTTTIDLGPVGTYDIQSPGVAGNETVYISRSVIVQAIEPGFTGEFDIRVEADSGQVLSESDETNNVAVSHFSQSPPDLGHWTSIGPRNMHEGLGASGRFQRIAITPTSTEPGSPLTIYAGAPSGSRGQAGGCGVWKSTNSGQTWDPVSDSLPSLAIVGLAIDPSMRTRVYAFTPDQGIYQTEDGGISWYHISTANFRVNASSVGGPYVDPNDSDRIFVAAADGVRRSTDRGVTWPVVLGPGGVSGLLFVPGPPTHLYAAIRDDNNLARTGVWFSPDGGDNWRMLDGCSGGELPTVTRPTTIRLARSGSKLYASYADSQRWTLYYTTDSQCSVDGQTEWFWEKGWEPADCTPPCTTTRSLLWSSIYADPVNPNYVYASGTRFFVSNDGGKNFTMTSNSAGPHDDQHGFAVNPWNPAHIYVVCDGGIYRSTNRGAPNSWEFIGDGVANVEFYDIANARTVPALVTGGTQDNGTLLYDGGSLKWSWIKGGDGSTVDIDPTNSQILYAMHQFACSMGRKIGNDNFAAIACQLPTAPMCRDLHYQVHPTTPTTVLASCDRSLWRANNPVCTEAPNCNAGTVGQPQEWARIFTPAIADGAVGRSTVDASINLYYAGTNTGRIFAGPAGADFQRVFRHPGNSHVSDIEVDLDNPTVIYASFGGGGADRIQRIVRTTDQPSEGNVQVTPIAQNLTAGIYVRTVAIDRNAPLTVYAGTTKGVYRGQSVDLSLIHI